MSAVSESVVGYENQLEGYRLPCGGREISLPGRRVLVEPRHFDIWNEYPNAVFVVRAAPAFSGVRYVLGGYELPEEH